MLAWPSHLRNYVANVSAKLWQTAVKVSKSVFSTHLALTFTPHSAHLCGTYRGAKNVEKNQQEVRASLVNSKVSDHAYYKSTGWLKCEHDAEIHRNVWKFFRIPWHFAVWVSDPTEVHNLCLCQLDTAGQRPLFISTAQTVRLCECQLMHYLSTAKNNYI